MIISYKHRFIFIKTKKTAGTSIEIALSRFCGDDDVITPIGRPDEALRQELGYRNAQNYALSESRQPEQNWTGGDVPKATHHFNHEPAATVRERVRPDIWDSYLKFSVERNPWDHAVSLYYFRVHRFGDKRSLSTFIREANPNALTNFRLYSIGGAVVLDHVMRYESLDQELIAIGERLQLPDRLQLPTQRAKSQYRIDRRHYRELLGAEERQIIARVCAKEIELFGYTF